MEKEGVGVLCPLNVYGTNGSAGICSTFNAMPEEMQGSTAPPVAGNMQELLGGTAVVVGANDSELYSPTTSRVFGEAKGAFIGPLRIMKPLRAQLAPNVGGGQMEGRPEKGFSILLQSMKNATSTGSDELVIAKANDGACLNGLEMRNSVTTGTVVEWLGLWTFMSVLYSPGTRPMLSAAVVLITPAAPAVGRGMLQIHFALYSNVGGGGGVALVSLTSPIANIDANIVEETIAARRTILSFLIFQPPFSSGYLSHRAPPRRSAGRPTSEAQEIGRIYVE